MVGENTSSLIDELHLGSFYGSPPLLGLEAN